MATVHEKNVTQIYDSSFLCCFKQYDSV